MNARVPSAYERGYAQALKDFIGFSAVTLHNLYGWKQPALNRFYGELTRVIRQARTDPDEMARVNRFIKELESGR